MIAVPPPVGATGLAQSPAMTAITALLEARTGQQIAEGRAWRLDTALKPLQRELGVEGLEPIAARLATGDGPLADQVVDALLNRESSFFRDQGVLDLLLDAVTAARGEGGQRRMRIWSAGCSHGQEPLSLAMLCDERGLAREVEIVATDVSASAVARARAARFSQFEIQRGLSVRRMMTWFTGDGGEWTCDPALSARIAFRRHNLVEDPPQPGVFDAIACRNVLLYFSPERRRAVFDRLAAALRPDGLLLLGAGETVIGQTDAFVPSQRWRGLYQRAADPPRPH